MDTSFDDREKRFLLAEMIKASHINLDAMVSFVKGCNILPDWHEMQIPRGRNINQCRQAAASMGIETHIMPQHQQQSYQQPGQHYSSAQQPPQHHQQHVDHQLAHHPGQHQHQRHHQAQPPPHLQPQQQQQQQQQQQLPLPPPFAAPKRKQSTDSTEHIPKRPAIASPEVHAALQPRSIQPRPPANGFAPANSGNAVAAFAPYRVPKKRGRPSRTDKIAQARAAGMTGHAFPYLAPATRPIIAVSELGPPIPSTPPSVSPKSQNMNPKAGEDLTNRSSLEQSPQFGQQTKARSPKSKGSPLEDVHLDKLLPEHQETHSPESPASAGLPLSSRVSVSDLIKTTTPAVVTTGV